MRELVWPVLAFPADSAMFEACKTLEALSRARPLGIRKKGFSGLRIYDSSGRCVVVKSVRVVRPRNRLLQMLAAVFNTVVHVQFEDVEDLGMQPLEEMKQRIYAAFDADPDWHSNVGSIASQKRAVAACATHREVIEHFIWW